MGKICTFFGHRFVAEPEKMEKQLKSVLCHLIQEGIDIFWLGGYGDFDQLAEKVTRNLKNEFPHIQRVLVLAYLPKNKEEYHYKEQFYDFLFYPEGVELSPKRFAISKRNKYLVQNADIIIAYIPNKYGGAYHATQEAKKLKKKTIILNTNLDPPASFYNVPQNAIEAS